MTSPEHSQPFTTPVDEFRPIMEEALGRRLKARDEEDFLSEEWEVARALVQIRLRNAADVFFRLQSGEDVPDSEIDYPALAVVHNVTSGIEQADK